MVGHQETPEALSEERGPVRFPPPLAYLAGLAVGAVLERMGRPGICPLRWQ